MKFSAIDKLNEQNTYDAEFILFFEDDIKKDKPELEILIQIDEKSGGLVSNLIKKKKVTGKTKNLTSIYVNNTRYTLLGMGKQNKHNRRSMMNIAGKICHSANANKDENVLIHMRTTEAQDFARTVEAIETANYTFLDYFDKEKSKDKKPSLKSVEFLTNDTKAVKDFIKKGKTIGIARNFARTLINHPSNKMTPEILAKNVEKELKECEIKVFNKAEIKKMKMGGLLGVNQAASWEPRFIIIKHNPEKKKKGIKIALVGKGVTFDTGGISLKPSKNMHEMKGDMGGAATVAGLMKIISELNIPLQITGYIPSTPNMPGGNAINPGDILTAYNGKTVEVLNTDAEGRLILMDALSYAVKEDKPTHIVDFATLTGAIVVALGTITTGLFSNNDEMAQGILNATEKSGEYVWRMPIHDEYGKLLESKIADLKNIGGRDAGSITAAKFLENFIDDTPWAHLDIAGTSYIDNHEYLKPSGMGAMISTITEWLLDFSK